MYIGTLNKQLSICKVDSSGNVLGSQGGCYNLHEVFEWVKRCIVSIFLVFFIAFLPLFLQGMYGYAQFDSGSPHRSLQNLSNVERARQLFVWRSTSSRSLLSLKCSRPKFTRKPS